MFFAKHVNSFEEITLNGFLGTIGVLECEMVVGYPTTIKHAESIVIILIINPPYLIIT
jgi:hypothetical protein